MDCGEVVKLMGDYIGHKLNSKVSAEIEAHLCDCEACRKKLSDLLDQQADMSVETNVQEVTETEAKPASVSSFSEPQPEPKKPEPVSLEPVKEEPAIQDIPVPDEEETAKLPSDEDISASVAAFESAMAQAENNAGESKPSASEPEDLDYISASEDEGAVTDIEKYGGIFEEQLPADSEPAVKSTTSASEKINFIIMLIGISVAGLVCLYIFL